MKTKIAYVIPTLSLGGAEKQQINILNGIDTSKYEVVVYILKNKLQLLPQVLNQDIKIEVCNIDSVFSIGRMILFIRKIKTFCPDIIHSQMYNANILIRLFKVFLPRTKIINHFHGMSAWLSKSKLYLDQSTSSLVDKFLVVSDRSAELRITREKYPTEKVLVLYNSVNLDIKINDVKFDISKQLVIGMASRLISLKNIQASIYMLSELLKKGLNLNLVVAGDGPEKDFLVDYTKELKIDDKVEFLGFVEDMKSFYEKIDIYCISSKTEDLPLSVIEAMMSGKPIISSNVGGIPDVLNGVQYTITIYDFFDEKELDKVYKMLMECNEKICASYLHQIAYNKFDNKAYCNQLDNLYQELLGK